MDKGCHNCKHWILDYCDETGNIVGTTCDLGYNDFIACACAGTEDYYEKEDNL